MAAANDYGSLRAYVQKADFSNDAVFTEVVQRVVQELQLLPADVGSALRVSRPTISRWIHGVTVPHPAVREPFRRYALRRIDALVQRDVPDVRVSAPALTGRRPSVPPAGASKTAHP